MQTVSYNDLTKRAKGLVLVAAKKGAKVYAEPARRGWTVFFEPVKGAYPVVDIPVNGVTQETVTLSQDAVEWIKAIKEALPALTESEIVCAALQYYYALYLHARKAEVDALPEDTPSPYDAEVIAQWQNETEAALD